MAGSALCEHSNLKLTCIWSPDVTIFPSLMPSEILLFISTVIGETLPAVELKRTLMNEVILSQVFHLEWESKRIMARQMSYFTTFCLQRHEFQSGTELLPMAATVALEER